jgi:phosphoserine phosphatase RsbU/P
MNEKEKILIAEDDPVSRRMIEALLEKWGYEVVVVCDGKQAWQILQGEDAPRLAILDWMMPEIDGVRLARQIRQDPAIKAVYIILLTSRTEKDDIIIGLEAGANDYITKPFEQNELRARIRVGERVLGLQSELAERVEELQEALTHVKTLKGLLPICCHCKKIRDDQNYWQQVESYISLNSEAEFTHSICPECLEKYYPLDSAETK